jgi:hypothetical protein
MNRKEVIDFLNNEETYNKVFNTIKDECHKNDVHLDDYSQDSYIAGGAVANTIHHFLNKNRPSYKNTRPVINDIDLFCFSRKSGYNWGLPLFTGENFIQQPINPTLNMDGYGRVWFGTMGESITMVNSERIGVINKVDIDVYLTSVHEFKVTDYYKQLLNNFDLNCCSAGIDRLNNKIVYTKEFVNFLVSNQIEVTMVAQPLQTSIRMFKKSKELKTNTSNFETEMSLLQHAFVNLPHNSLGQEWWEKSKKYSSFISNYFEFVNVSSIDGGLFTYTSKDFKLVKYFDQFKFNSESSLVGFWDLFVRNKNQEVLDKIITFYTQNTNFSLEHKENMKWSTTRRYRTKINSISNDFDFIDTLGSVPDYFDCDFNLNDLVVVNLFNTILEENLIDPRMCLTNNIKTHVKFIKFFTDKFIDKHGFVKRCLINSLVTKIDPLNKLKINTFNCDDKIEAFNRIINNLWFNMSDSFKYRHKFNWGDPIYLSTINLDDINF